MKFTVLTNELRRAMRAVVPHADPESDFPQLHRVRLDRNPETITVSATNRYSVGYATAGLFDQGDGELGPFDLSPTDVMQILGLFTGKASDGKEDPGATLEFTVGGEHLTVTDMSGLFAGKALTLPRYPMEDNFPDLGTVIAAKLERQQVGGDEDADRLITSGKLLALFVKATAAYGYPLVIDPAGNTGAMLITCGEHFVGLLMPQRTDEHETAKINGWHIDWLMHLAQRVPTSAAP